MARTKKKAVNQNAEMKVQTVEEWLAQGNKITICPPGMRSEDVVEKQRGRKKKTARKKN